MNTLSSLSPPVLVPVLAPGTLPGGGQLAPATAPTLAAQQVGAWLDEIAQGRSEPLHVSPHSRARPIEDIECDFVQALCVSASDHRG